MYISTSLYINADNHGRLHPIKGYYPVVEMRGGGLTLSPNVQESVQILEI